MNDILVFGGAACVVLGCLLIAPALAVVAVGLLLLAAGLVRIRGEHGPG